MLYDATMSVVSDLNICDFFSGGGTSEERSRVMLAILKGGEVCDVYNFLLDYESKGIVEKIAAVGIELISDKLASLFGPSAGCGMMLDTSSSGGITNRIIKKIKTLGSDRKEIEKKLINKAIHGDYDDLMDYVYPVCKYLSAHFKDYDDNEYFTLPEVQSDAFVKLSEKDGAFIKNFQPEKSSIKTWLTVCLFRDLDKKRQAIERDRERYVSMDKPLASADSEVTLADVLPDKEQPSCVVRDNLLKRLLAAMDDVLERKIIQYRWIDNRSAKSIAQEMGWSTAKVYRTEKTGLQTLQRLAQEMDAM